MLQGNSTSLSSHTFLFRWNLTSVFVYLELQTESDPEELNRFFHKSPNTVSLQVTSYRPTELSWLIIDPFTASYPLSVVPAISNSNINTVTLSAYADTKLPHTFSCGIPLENCSFHNNISSALYAEKLGELVPLIVRTFDSTRFREMVIYFDHRRDIIAVRCTLKWFIFWERDWNQPNWGQL